jgi:D-glycero-D-manno-heptose 1,7-bisphosphate phosphatase
VIIILDRDGVINQDSDGYIKHPDEWIPIPGSLEAIAQLYKTGFTILVVTNQSGIGRGLYTEEDYKKITKKMLTMIETAGGHIEKIYYCAHAPEVNCDCRKPAPGMFHQIEKDFGVQLDKNYLFIGDKFSDIQAARNAHCTPVLLRTGYGIMTLKQHPELENEIAVYADLQEAVQAL